MLRVDPGILAGAVDAEPVQTVTSVDIRPADGVDPVVFSDSSRDLEAVTRRESSRIGVGSVRGAS